MSFFKVFGWTTLALLAVCIVAAVMVWLTEHAPDWLIAVLGFAIVDLLIATVVFAMIGEWV